MKCRNCGKEFENVDYPEAQLCSQACGQAVWEKKQGVLNLTGREDLSYFLGYRVVSNRLKAQD